MITGIRWRRPPSVLAAAVEEYGERVLVAVMAVAQYIATKTQNEMRAQAPWTDRTGNARSGLFSQAEEAAARDAVVIYLSHGHTVDYGRWLELANGGRYQIIMPTLENNIGEVERLLDGIFR